jgi:hypothetical protein
LSRKIESQDRRAEILEVGLSVPRPSNNEPVGARRRAAGLPALLGTSAASLVALGVLSLLAAHDVEPFAGSAPVLVGLMGGAGLVVAGLTGIALRPVRNLNDTPVIRLNNTRVIRGEVLNERSHYHAERLNELASRRRGEDTRALPAVSPPPPPRRTNTRFSSNGAGTSYVSHG